MNEQEAPVLHLVTLAEAAERIGKSPKTVNNWIHSGRLGGKEGLCYVVSRPMIDWPLFERAFVRRANP